MDEMAGTVGGTGAIVTAGTEQQHHGALRNSMIALSGFDTTLHKHTLECCVCLLELVVVS
jgi:hypothetical protein